MVRVTFCLRRLWAPILDFRRVIWTRVAGGWMCSAHCLVYDNKIWTHFLLYDTAECCCRSFSIMLRPRAWVGYFAECGKLSRDNLQKFKCGTLRKLHPLSLFHIPQPKNAAFLRIAKLPFARIVQQMCNRCTATSGVPRFLPSIFFVVRLPKKRVVFRRRV